MADRDTGAGEPTDPTLPNQQPSPQAAAKPPTKPEPDPKQPKPKAAPKPQKLVGVDQGTPGGDQTALHVGELSPQFAPRVAMAGYPEGFPLDSVRELLSVVRGGNALARKAEFAFHVWLLGGYLLRMTLGNPQPALDTNVLTPRSQEANHLVGVLEELLQEQGKRLQAQSLEDEPAVPQVLPVAAVLEWSLTKLFALLEEEVKQG